VGLDLTSDGPGALVAGPSGSGRSTALHTAAVHHVLGGGSVAVVGGRRSPVTELAGAPGVLGTFAAGDGDALLHAVAGGQGPVLVVVDDADQLLDTSVDAAISRILSDGRHGVLVAGVAADLLALYRGCTVDVRRSRCGLLLCPSGPQDGELLGVTLSRRQDTRPGRGVLVRRGTITQIQTAQATPAAAGGRRARAGQPMCG
jgi:S-DNA-T family DNA segregation ATPase FtsK/SpoIIIE